MKEAHIRETAELGKKASMELEILRQDVKRLEADLRTERERASRGEHVEAAQKKIASLEKELDGYRKVAEKKFDATMSERLQLEDRISELSALIGTYEEKSLRDTERIRDLEEQGGVGDIKSLEQGHFFLISSDHSRANS